MKKGDASLRLPDYLLNKVEKGSVTSPKISISNLIDFVKTKKIANEVFSKDVCQNLEIDCTFIKSVYGRNKFNEWLQKCIDADAVLYINKEKAVQLETKSSSQWLEKLKEYNFDTIIHRSRAIVNRLYLIL